MDNNLTNYNAGGTADPSSQANQSSQAFLVPPADIFEDDQGITLLADLPGVTRESLGLRVEAENLFIEANAVVKGPEGMQLLYGEAYIPTYRRQFRLSRELDSSRIDAQLKDGVLRLVIPKAEEAKPRRIKVRMG